jgi:hypothetical protein
MRNRRAVRMVITHTIADVAGNSILASGVATAL